MRVLVGLSGGADSAAVALSLKEAGHRVIGVYLRLCDEADDSGARFVAERLGIELYVVEARDLFRESVMADFAAEYARGRTPNPCAKCNREVKIRLLCEEALRLGCERVATGHYAGVLQENGRFFVRAGADVTRDQSYFLWRLEQKQLSMLLFVLSDAKKAELTERVRPLLPEGTRESREVCFVPGDDRVSYLASVLPERALVSGEFVDETGRVIGRHEGIWRYTVGQRRGLGVGFGRRMYVKSVEAESRRVVLAEKQACESAGCTFSHLNFQRLAPQTGTFRVLCRARYRAALMPAEITLSGEEGSLRLLEGRRTVFAPGQSLVCYDESGALLCGGILETARD